MLRSAVKWVGLILIAASSQISDAGTLSEARAGDSGLAADPQSETMHFNLLGPDWARIPEGYSGVTPEKIIAELNIPKEYVVLHNPFRTNGPLTQNEGSIPLAVFYPSMKGAAEYGAADGPFSETQIYLALDAGREEASRKGVRFLLSHEGMKRNSELDVGGLCGYVDEEHPGSSGQEFYSSCDEAEQTFFIDCFQPFNNHRSCGETAFFEGQIGAELSYQYPMLKDHRALLNAMKRLVRSFVQPNTQKDN